jgi:hypothetical protein
MSRIVSFRGKATSGSQETVHLHTNDGSTGYSIRKLEIMGAEPGTGTYELVLQIWTVEQTAVVGTVDFSDQTLLGVGYHRDNAGSQYPESTTIIFDNATFNQNIYLTAIDMSGNVKPINWHIELEQVKLDLNENTVATLKDIRNVA